MDDDNVVFRTAGVMTFVAHHLWHPFMPAPWLHVCKVASLVCAHAQHRSTCTLFALTLMEPLKLIDVVLLCFSLFFSFLKGDTKVDFSPLKPRYKHILGIFLLVLKDSVLFCDHQVPASTFCSGKKRSICTTNT